MPNRDFLGGLAGGIAEALEAKKARKDQEELRKTQLKLIEQQIAQGKVRLDAQTTLGDLFFGQDSTIGAGGLEGGKPVPKFRDAEGGLGLERDVKSVSEILADPGGKLAMLQSGMFGEASQLQQLESREDLVSGLSQSGQSPMEFLNTPEGAALAFKAGASPASFLTSMSGANLPGDIQIINRINTERAAQGKAPMTTEEYLASKRGTSSLRQAYDVHVAQSEASGESPLSFEEFSEQYAGTVERAKRISDVGTRRLDTLYEDALSGETAIGGISEAEALLDQGVRTGTAAGARQFLARALDTILGRETDQESLQANTDAYIANAGALVGQVIRQFGSGTGLSDADREYAERMAAGSISITEGALRRILQIQRKAAKRKIERFNKAYDKFQDDPNVKLFYDRVAEPSPGGSGWEIVRDADN